MKIWAVVGEYQYAENVSGPSPEQAVEVVRAFTNEDSAHAFREKLRNSGEYGRFDPEQPEWSDHGWWLDVVEVELEQREPRDSGRFAGGRKRSVVTTLLEEHVTGTYFDSKRDAIEGALRALRTFHSYVGKHRLKRTGDGAYDLEIQLSPRRGSHYHRGSEIRREGRKWLARLVGE